MFHHDFVSEMDTWKADDVCAWLGTIEGIEQTVIDLFKSKKIRGKALKKMSEEQMIKHFSQMEIGDVWEILEERDNFVSQFQHKPQDAVQEGSPILPSPSVDRPTTHSHVLNPSVTTEQSNKHPVQCSSMEHHFSLDMFVRPKSVDEYPQGANEQERSPGEYPSENDIMLHASRESAAQLQQPSIKPQETPLKQPYKEDSHNTPLKMPVEHDLLKTPRKQTIEHNLQKTPLEEKEVHDVNTTPHEELASAHSQTETSQTDHSFNPLIPVEQRFPSRESSLDMDHETPLKRLEDSLSRENKSEAEQKPSITHCRKFNTEVDQKTYQKDSVISCQEGVQEGPVMFIHKFVDTESINTKRERVLFMKETIAFICACLNERYDGTIHFGITSKDTRQKESRDEHSRIIKGVQFSYNWNEFEEEFKKAIHKCFPPDQIDIVFHCIHPLRRIPVVQVTNSAAQSEELFVIEIDISPTSALCAEEAFFVKLPSYQKKKLSYSQESNLFRCFDGSVRKCSGEELKIYMENRCRIAEDRRRKEEHDVIEKSKQTEIQEDLHMKLCDLLCKGGDNMPVDTYPIVVVSKPPDSMTQEEMQSKLSFLATMPFKVTFDFDENGTLSEYIENVEKKPLKLIATADDFKKKSDANLRSPDRLKNLHEDIQNSAIPSWIPANKNT